MIRIGLEKNISWEFRFRNSPVAPKVHDRFIASEDLIDNDLVLFTFTTDQHLNNMTKKIHLAKLRCTEIFTKWIWSLINFDLTNFFNAFIWFMWNTRKNGFRMIWMIIPGALGIQSFSEFSWKPFPQILMAVYLHGSQGSSTLCVTWTQQSHVFTSDTDEI